ncbi:NAD(P)-dependent oxidoreductase [Marinigracilibium pacificum]|uniref:Phosphoglycerate dehydrogenase n=1 Tax=Marinigracilibium pacificum TaxID=2729599 RepID=A0A848J5H5_9BACT|nr:NAD(P)-dependent oxidoreductase [Marinigracilibium pacificum]NMM50725.1 phosphoglycerate dehydrogenase [Marinigracilibium pacificum]
MKKCLIIDKMHESIITGLQKLKIAVEYKPDLTPEELPGSLEGVHILVVRSKVRIDQSLLMNASDLEIVCRAGAGIDNLDTDLLEEKGIKIINAPEGNRDAVAEHTIAMMLSLLNFIPKADEEVRKMIWDREGNRGFELRNRTVGLIGYGYMGRAVARRLQPFKAKVLAYDKYLPKIDDDFAKKVSLEELQEEADVVSLHIPLTDETKNMVDDDFFKNFKKKILFINTARGEITSFKSLLNAFENNYVWGMGLDVLPKEKMNKLDDEEKNFFEQLTRKPNTLFTPHVAGWTFESYEKISEVIVEKIALILNKN